MGLVSSTRLAQNHGLPKVVFGNGRRMELPAVLPLARFCWCGRAKSVTFRAPLDGLGADCAVAAVYTKSQSLLDGAVDKLFLGVFVSAVSGIAWDLHVAV